MGSEFHAIEQQINELSRRVALLEQATGVSQSIKSPAAQSQEKAGTDHESTLLRDSSSLLKLASILCFLLVAALGLRALTDNDILNPQIGSILGLTYASGLVISGHLFYRKANPLGPITCTTGALLIFSIMIETSTRFTALPEELAYLMLAATGIGLAAISHANRVALPIIIGTLGMCFSAVAIGYPTPNFPYLSLMLWASNILGFFATRLQRCSWLRWLLMFTTHLTLQAWGLKLSGVMLHDQESFANLSPAAFIPIVTLIGFTFVLIALFGIIRSGDEKVSKFDFSLPAVNASWCYVAGIYALKNPPAFGAPAAAAAIVHFALAYWLSKRPTANAQGTNTFMTGGLILAGLSLPALCKDMFLPLPILSALALATFYYSRQWSSGGMRISSYLLQIYISAIIVIKFIGNTPQQLSFSVFSITLFCACMALAHYRLARQHSPPARSQIFTRYDRQDHSGLLPLLAGLGNAYFFAMLIAYSSLHHYYSGDFAIAATSLQSIVINLSAILLTVLAVVTRNNELRNVSICILLIGAGKVFIIDILKISGTWLVISIFSSGLAAALESLVLARWKNATDTIHAKPEAPEETLNRTFSDQK